MLFDSNLGFSNKLFFLIVVAILWLMVSKLSYSSEAFYPRLIHGSDERLCLDYFDVAEKNFLSSNFNKRKYLDSSKAIDVNFEKLSVEWFHGALYRHDVSDDITVIYHLSPDGLNKSENLIYVVKRESIDKALIDIIAGEYVEPDLSFNTSGYDVKEFFKHDNRLFIYYEEIQDQGLRTYIGFKEILGAGGINDVCRINVFPETDVASEFMRFPFFKNYIWNYSKIAGFGNVCTSQFYLLSLNQVMQQVLMAIYRPWALAMDDLDYLARIKNGLEYWSYIDVWNNRQYIVSEFAMDYALVELNSYYKKNFERYGYKSDWAEGALNSIVQIYFSFEVNEEIELDHKKIVNFVEGGDIRDFNNLISNMKSGYYTNLISTLFIDNFKEIEELTSVIDIEKVKTPFNKDLLMYAVQMNNLDATTALLNMGWDLTRSTDSGKNRCVYNIDRSERTALSYASEYSSPIISELLIRRGAENDTKDSLGNDISYYRNKNKLLRFNQDEFLEKENEICSVNSKFVERICTSANLLNYELSMNLIVSSLDEYILSIVEQQSWLEKRESSCGVSLGEDEFNSCVSKLTHARYMFLIDFI